MNPFCIVLAALSSFVLSALGEPLLASRDLNYGKATWFYDGLGACQDYNTDSDPVIAISRAIFGNGEYCNQWITITDTNSQQTVSGVVKDMCPGCGPGDLDLSVSLFSQLAVAEGGLPVGHVAIMWSFN